MGGGASGTHYRLDVDEMEDRGCFEAIAWVLAVRSGYFQQQGEEPQKKTKFQETSATSDALEGFETLGNCQVGRWVPESLLRVGLG